MTAKTYRVRVVRGDLELEVDGDKKFVLDMLARFATPSEATALGGVERPTRGGGKRSSPSSSTSPSSPSLPTAARTVSAGEFIRQFGFKRHTDIVLAFGYYLEQHTGLKEFTPADINNTYYEAKMEGSNTSQAIIYNIRRGHMMLAKGQKGAGAGRKKYTLTQSGEAYLRGRLQKATEKPAK
jgi:hypothetical protein